MHSWSILFIACSFVILIHAEYFGDSEYEPLMRMPRSPARMMVHGYLLRHPQVAMTAFASGPFYGRRGSCANCNQVEEETPALGEDEETPVEEVTSEDQTEAPETKEPKEAPETKEPKEVPEPKEAEETPELKKPKVAREPKASKHPVQVDEDEDEEDDVVPISKGRKVSRGQGPSYHNFFPMVFASRRSSGRNDDNDESGLNPGLTAIANSFSTGKGAIAASTATAYGAPSASQLRRGSPSRYRSS